MTTFLRFSVIGVEPAPWTVPTLGSVEGKDGKRRRFSSRGRKDDVAKSQCSYKHWKEMVSEAAKQEMVSKWGNPAPVITNHVAVTFEFFSVTPPGFRHGQLWHRTVKWNKSYKNKDGTKGRFGKTNDHNGVVGADLTNLQKGTEDAIEGIAFVNDWQVCQIISVGLYGPMPGVRVTVQTFGENDYVGEGDVITED